MPFCSNCGIELKNGARFCQKCGTATHKAEACKTARQFEYSGKVFKCPACGETLESFTHRCPACGLELRGVKATNSVREFALKLEAIESYREYEKPPGVFSRINRLQHVSKTDEQKINLIKSFSVPNTKEDILEFMILATSNIDMTVYNSLDTPTTGAKSMAEAWISKIKQVYLKAKSMHSLSSDFTEIKSLYDQCIADIKKHKNRKIIKWVLLVGWVPMLWAIIIIPLIVLEPKEEAKEIERLESIVVTVEDALGNKEYKLALNHADSIDYIRYDIEMERQWDIQREYWVDKVLETALANGIVLDYSRSEDIDNANDYNSNDTDVVDGFAEGFQNGIQSGLDEAEENIDKFNRIINGEENTN